MNCPFVKIFNKRCCNKYEMSFSIGCGCGLSSGLLDNLFTMSALNFSGGRELYVMGDQITSGPDISFESHKIVFAAEQARRISTVNLLK